MVGQFSMMLSAYIILLLSRYMFHDQVQAYITTHKWLKRNFSAINELMVEKGTLIVTLIRVAPGPFGGISYLIGVTDIKAKDYVIGNFGYIARIVPRVYMGCLMYNISKGEDQTMSDPDASEEDSTTNDVLFWVNFVLSLASGFILGYCAKRKIE